MFIEISNIQSIQIIVERKMYKTFVLNLLKNKIKEGISKDKNKHNHPVYVIFEYQVCQTADDVYESIERIPAIGRLLTHRKLCGY